MHLPKIGALCTDIAERLRQLADWAQVSDRAGQADVTPKLDINKSIEDSTAHRNTFSLDDHRQRGSGGSAFCCLSPAQWSVKAHSNFEQLAQCQPVYMHVQSVETSTQKCQRSVSHNRRWTGAQSYGNTGAFIAAMDRMLIRMADAARPVCTHLLTALGLYMYTALLGRSRHGRSSRQQQAPAGYAQFSTGGAARSGELLEGRRPLHLVDISYAALAAAAIREARSAAV